MIIYHQHEISDQVFMFEFRDFDWILTVGHWAKSRSRDSRVFHHHHEISYPYCIIMPYIENLVQMTMSQIHKTFLVLRPFEGALTCSILIVKMEKTQIPNYPKKVDGFLGFCPTLFIRQNWNNKQQ
jgi:hypothetical protein